MGRFVVTKTKTNQNNKQGEEENFKYVKIEPPVVPSSNGTSQVEVRVFVTHVQERFLEREFYFLLGQSPFSSLGFDLPNFMFVII